MPNALIDDPRPLVYTLCPRNPFKHMVYRALHIESAQAVYRNWCADCVLDECTIVLAVELPDGSFEALETRFPVLNPTYQPLPTQKSAPMPQNRPLRRLLRHPYPQVLTLALVALTACLLILGAFSCTDQLVRELAVPLAPELSNHEIPGSELDVNPVTAAKARMKRRLEI